MSAGPCTLCGGDHARSACPWAKPAADLRAVIVGIRTRPRPLTEAIPAIVAAAQVAADALEAAGAEIARLRRALDNRVPIDTAAELRWRVRELEAHLAEVEAWQAEGAAIFDAAHVGRPLLFAAFRTGVWWGERPWRKAPELPGCGDACDQGRRPCTCPRGADEFRQAADPAVESWHLPHLKKGE